MLKGKVMGAVVTTALLGLMGTTALAAGNGFGAGNGVANADTSTAVCPQTQCTQENCDGTQNGEGGGHHNGNGNGSETGGHARLRNGSGSGSCRR
ncbi:hypothetical protein [Eubacterium aggregans]|uniref:hypothetical protein n=1 Tax=Eubacterium aggregans TaxID=81409 RepID=UPI003F30E7AE